ncbi:SIMPL domain-containing protein [Peribacillus sp. NPDC096379]|uniref:SIMPL domain-containing protein n=1 Tax=Peribacillus sp. NPDC096379 TaxID=3364393 RepID=UPI0037FD1105
MNYQSSPLFRGEADQHSREGPNKLTVIGEATIQAPPDQALITLGVITENKDPILAQQQNATAMAKVLTGLADLGIPDDQIKTKEYRMDPQYDYLDGKEIFKNYKVHHMIEIRTKNIDRVGNIVDTSIKNGSNSVSNIRFSLSQHDMYYNQALALALQNAKQKALALAKAADVTLQQIPETIEEIPAGSTPVLYQTSFVAKAASTQIQPGELEIKAIVKVIYTFH